MDKYEAIFAARVNATCGYKGGSEPKWRCVGYSYKNGAGMSPHYTVILQDLRAEGTASVELPIHMVSVFRYPGRQADAKLAVERLRNGVDHI